MSSTTTHEAFTPERVTTLNDALDVLEALRDDVARLAWNAPSDVSTPTPRAQDYGKADGIARMAAAAITQLLIVAEVNLGTGNLIRSLDDDD